MATVFEDGTEWARINCPVCGAWEMHAIPPSASEVTVTTCCHRCSNTYTIRVASRVKKDSHTVRITEEVSARKRT